jgi:hypothetical protein
MKVPRVAFERLAANASISGHYLAVHVIVCALRHQSEAAARAAVS